MPTLNSRYISNLTKDTYALILAGGKGSRLHELTQWRAKPAVYFGGKFRIIDFPLSNCINSGIRRVGIATQYKSHSLIRHVNRAWGHFKKELGESVEILPASQRKGDAWYQGTADAVYQNIDIIRHELPKYVMVLAGDHVYRMDYGDLLAKHVESGAEMTVCCIEVPQEEAAGRFGVMTVDEEHWVKRFDEKPENPSTVPGKPGVTLASMGNYVFNTEFLFEQLHRDSERDESGRDFGNDIIPAIIEEHKVLAYPFLQAHDQENKAYWRDVGTLDSFWEANMELVSREPLLDLYDRSWPIWTYQEQLAPAKFVSSGDVQGIAIDSTVSAGCIVSGATIRNSLLFSDVTVRSNSEVDHSVVLPGCKIGRGCKIKKAIIDRSGQVPDGLVVGYDHEEDRKRGFRVSENGVVLLTRETLAALG